MWRDIGGPPNNRVVGQGPRALPGVREKLGSGRGRHRPLRKRILWCVGAGMVREQKDRADTSVSALRLWEKPGGFSTVF